MPNPELGYGDKLIGAVARGGNIILATRKAAWLPAIETFIANAVGTAVTIVSNNFPRQSLEERALGGPIIALLKNSTPDIVKALSGFVSSNYDALTEQLDRTAKATNI